MLDGARRRDFVELSEDLSHSPLWNPDLAPTCQEFVQALLGRTPGLTGKIRK